jgi:hypothetical protein
LSFAGHLVLDQADDGSDDRARPTAWLARAPDVDIVAYADHRWSIGKQQDCLLGIILAVIFEMGLNRLATGARANPRQAADHAKGTCFARLVQRYCAANLSNKLSVALV